MFIGHFGLGFGAKSVAPRVSLGTLFLASQFIDLLWPTLLLVGMEHVRIDPGNTVVTPLSFTHYPVSHSLLMVAVWALLFGVTHFAQRRSLRAAAVLAALIVSHWVLDLIVHRPDLPLYPGDAPMAGLGLWSSLAGTIAVEMLIVAAGVALYTRRTRAKNSKGKWGLVALVTMLVVVQAMNLFGPPPPNVAAIAWAGQLQWLFVFMAYWVDRNRTTSHAQAKVAAQKHARPHMAH